MGIMLWIQWWFLFVTLLGTRSYTCRKLFMIDCSILMILKINFFALLYFPNFFPKSCTHIGWYWCTVIVGFNMLNWLPWAASVNMHTQEVMLEEKTLLDGEVTINTITVLFSFFLLRGLCSFLLNMHKCFLLCFRKSWKRLWLKICIKKNRQRKNNRCIDLTCRQREFLIFLSENRYKESHMTESMIQWKYFLFKF